MKAWILNPGPALAFLLLFSARAGDDWPQFRGPDGQGHSDSTGIPLNWSETQNVQWKTSIPGMGWSSPVILSNQIWMTTGMDKGKSLRAVCVDRNTGKLVYNVEVFTNEAPGGINDLNTYASPTPIVEPGRVYVYYGTYGLAALSTDTGKILWQNRDLKLEHEVGPGSSPAMYHENLLIPSDGTNVQYVAAVNKFTGRLVWKVNRSGHLSDSPPKKKAFYTPLVISVNGRDEAIIPGADHVYSYEPETGKEIWTARFSGFSAAPRPVFGDGLLFICGGFGRTGMLAIRPDGGGDVTSTHIAWQNAKQIPKRASPLFVEDKLFMVSDDGIASALDAKTGQELWRERLDGEYSASPIFVDNRIYFFNQTGVATVIEPSPTFHVLSTNRLDEGFMASPAVAGKALYLRTKTSLYRIEESKF